uniref:Uncharacterized protein n=1 Tax=Anguilla anguilla TaxID=7936 RepID=A0A0E9PPP5_ANGAN
MGNTILVGVRLPQAANIINLFDKFNTYQF